jgi:large subunit ribosomal protein L6
MSRIGKLPVVLLEKVQAKVSGNEIEVSWPLWTLKLQFLPLVWVSMEGNEIIVTPTDIENPLSKALWWTTRANINNMVLWVSAWYTKSLEINWVWYKFEVTWPNKLVLSIWYSHKVDVDAPAWITLKQDDKAKNVIHISWIDKQLVWEFASKIKAMKKPEPYKGKWIKYVWENIRRKAWKSGK